MNKNAQTRKNAKLPALLLLASTLLLGTSSCLAQTSPLKSAISEAIAVHAMATASRICGFIAEVDLNRMRMRMDRVHASELGRPDQETYLIMRASDSFKDYVYTNAMHKVQSGCTAELRTAWNELNASLVFAEITSQDVLADAATPSVIAQN
jgi:hypothetical protein